MSLPRIVREASVAAVGAARARTTLDDVTAAAEALSGDTAEASARLPQCRAAAAAAHATLVERAPALLQVRVFCNPPCLLAHLLPYMRAGSAQSS